jgi:hypothetical protein
VPRNFPVAERAAHLERMLATTEAELAKITTLMEGGRLTDPAKVGKSGWAR